MRLLGGAQVLSTRARKDVKVADIKVQVCLFAFDCLYLDGAELLQRPLTERRAALYTAVNQAPGELLFATAKVPPPPGAASRAGKIEMQWEVGINQHLYSNSVLSSSFLCLPADMSGGEEPKHLRCCRRQPAARLLVEPAACTLPLLPAYAILNPKTLTICPDISPCALSKKMCCAARRRRTWRSWACS